MHQRVAVDRRRGLLRRRVLDDLPMQLCGGPRRHEQIVMLRHSPAGPLARVTVAAREEFRFDEVRALRGGERDVPAALKVGNGFDGVIKVYTGKQLASLRLRERLQAQAPAHDQARHRFHERPHGFNGLVGRAWLLPRRRRTERSALRLEAEQPAAAHRPCCSQLAFYLTPLTISGSFTHRRRYLSRTTDCAAAR